MLKVIHFFSQTVSSEYMASIDRLSKVGKGFCCKCEHDGFITLAVI